MNHLFAYGTLMAPEVSDKIFGRTSTEKAILENYRSYKVYCGAEELFYPAVIAEREAATEGIVFRNLSEEELALLDEYEGNEYERCLVPVKTKGKTMNAWTYIWKSNNRFTLEGKWSVDEFRQKHLDDFLQDLL